ncbi:AMP-binding protein [Actinomyces wuliandei]|uniref:AMP-binding protein n=1 Tax=Actinomyces wuliandei TaxID=2057743 RepID=UPI0013E2ACFD|nr:AMP-binding protein [Actinomyces wuliandei]
MSITSSPPRDTERPGESPHVTGGRSRLGPGWTPVPAELARRYRQDGYWTTDLLGDVARPTEGTRDRLAVIDPRHRWTYARLEEEVAALCPGWQGLGLRPGDTVVVQLPNCAEFVAVLLSLWRVGAVPVMSLPAHRASEITDFAHHARARAYVSSERSGDFDQVAMGRRLRAGLPDLVHVVVPQPAQDTSGPGETQHGTNAGGAEGAGDATDTTGTPSGTSSPVTYEALKRSSPRKAEGADLAAPNPFDVALLQLSGGSTGTPKLIPRTHADYLYSVRASVGLCGVDRDTTLLCALPCAHNFAMSSAGILGQLLAGGSVVMAPDPSAATAFRLIEQEKVTHAALVPPMVLLWLARAAKTAKAARTSRDETARSPGSGRPADAVEAGSGRRGDPLETLRVLHVGGSRLPEEVARRVRPELGCRLQQVFGMAEGLVCYTRLDDPDDVIVSAQGRPLSPADEVLVVDDQDREVPDGTAGHLLTRGPYTIRGYFRAAEHNRASFTPDGFYRTGDVVVRGPGGNLRVVGRAKEQINRGGEKIAAGDLENHLQAHPDVFEAAVTGEPDPVLGERIVAHLVLRPDTTSPWHHQSPAQVLTEVRSFLRERSVATYKMPDKVLLVTTLPRTAVGKTSVAQIRDPGAQPPAARTAPAARDRRRGLDPDFLPAVPPQRPDAVRRLLHDGQDLGHLLARLEAGGGYLVEDGPEPGTCTVTLARAVADPRETAVAVFDTITHMHKEDLSPFVLGRHTVHGVPVHASAFVLPRGLRATTSLLVGPDLDLHLGRDREAWVRALHRAEPLSTRHEVVRVDGARSTVISLPGALPQPFVAPATGTTGTPFPKGRTVRGRVTSSVLGLDLEVWCHLPAAQHGQSQALLIASDGQVLTSHVPLLPCMDRLNASGQSLPVAAVLFSPADPRRRPEVLGMVPELADCLATEVLAWAAEQADLPRDPARRAVSGASLGGLAAADLVRRRPDLVSNAIVQSGAFWWPADACGEPTHAQLRLWQDHVGPSRPPVRVFQEVGTMEGHLLGCNRRFRDVLRERGVDLAYREYVGGHDYACWRGGIIDGLLHFFPGQDLSGQDAAAVEAGGPPSSAAAVLPVDAAPVGGTDRAVSGTRVSGERA